ncbi:MAG: hypothetical protein Q4G68_10305 [Planctomycetia bacterium]|nr:hypothetical protein [Planctomycetia bacterium]
MRIPFFLFPGVACLRDVYEDQIRNLSPYFDVCVPKLLTPRRGETLECYALRWAQEVFHFRYGNTTESNVHERSEGCFIGGLSLGGIVAPLIGDFLQENGCPVHGCFCFAAYRDGTEMPESLRWQYRLLNPFFWHMEHVMARTALCFANPKDKLLRVLLHQFALSSPRTSARTMKLVYRWRSPCTEHEFPIWRIHAEDDRSLPLRFTKTDSVLHSGGHFITVTQPQKVNDFIMDHVTSLPSFTFLKEKSKVVACQPLNRVRKE